MKLNCLIVGLVSVITFSTTAFSMELGNVLSSWLKQKDSHATIMTSTKKVIAYFKRPHFEDRSGTIRSYAIAEEKIYSTNYLEGKIAQIQSSLTSSSKVLDDLWSSQALVMQVDRASLRALKKRGDIEAIIANKPIQLAKPMIGPKVKMDETKFTYGLQLLHVPEAWQLGIKGAGTIVGIIDSGIDHHHPDLQGRVFEEKDFTKDGTTEDKLGHGTHVAGTIAGGNASGIQIGISPKSKLVIAKVFGKTGSTDMATLLKAMQWVLDPDGNPNTNDTPRVINNSWGAASQFILGFRNIVQTWRRFNIFPNFAAGNSGPRWMSTGAPARYPFSFAVAAVDENETVASFSSRGPSLWLRGWGTADHETLHWWQKWWPKLYTKPDVSAPGVSVYSSLPGGKYGRYSGTSMATPHVTGVVALALGANPNLSVDQLEQILESSAVDRAKAGKDNAYGYGVVQADKVVQAAYALKDSAAQNNGFVDTNPDKWQWPTP